LKSNIYIFVCFLPNCITASSVVTIYIISKIRNYCESYTSTNTVAVTVIICISYSHTKTTTTPYTSFTIHIHNYYYNNHKLTFFS
jgi:hypothetical protein